jgi:hypothetical protein
MVIPPIFTPKANYRLIPEHALYTILQNSCPVSIGHQPLRKNSAKLDATYFDCGIGPAGSNRSDSDGAKEWSILHTERRYVYIIHFFLLPAATTLWSLFSLLRNAKARYAKR